MKLLYMYNPRNNEYSIYKDIPYDVTLIKKGTAIEVIEYLIECINEQRINVDKKGDKK